MPTIERYKLDLSAPHVRYLNAAGKRLPGVTTVLGVLGKDALIEWAAREERDAIVRLLNTYDHASQILNLIPEPYAYTVKRDRAADIGSVCHARIHAYSRGMELDEEGLPPEAVDKSMNGFIRWHDWFKGEGLNVVASELPLVSEAMQVGGTLDIVAASSSGLTLCDVKSSNPHPRWPWDEVVGQVAAYAMIWNETHGDRIARCCSYRCGKTEGDAGQVAWFTGAQMDAGADLFRAALAAYRAKSALGRA